MYGEFARLIYENQHHHVVNNDPEQEIYQSYLYVARLDDQKNESAKLSVGVEAQQMAQKQNDIIKMIKDMKNHQTDIETTIMGQLKKMHEQIDAIVKA